MLMVGRGYFDVRDIFLVLTSFTNT